MTEGVSKLDPRASIAEIYDEGLRYFMGEGKLNKTLERLAADLNEHEIDYVVIGAVALLAYGYPRFTEDMNLVMTAEGLEKFHKELVGLRDFSARSTQGFGGRAGTDQDPKVGRYICRTLRPLCKTKIY